jgi:hypothetical protein
VPDNGCAESWTRPNNHALPLGVRYRLEHDRAGFTPKRSVEGLGLAWGLWGTSTGVRDAGVDAEGRLFCPSCAPVETLRQSVTVKMTGPISVWMKDGVIRDLAQRHTTLI